MTFHLAWTELRLLLRKRITAYSVLAAPVLLCAMAWFADRTQPTEAWAGTMGSRFVLLMVISVYLVSTTVFTARRQSLVLKRLRTSELTDTAIYLGIGAPMMVVGLAQTIVYFGFCLAVGAPLPSNPAVVLVGVILGIAVALLAGIATAAFSRSVEVTQITAIPVMLAAIAGMVMVQSSNDVVSTIGTFLPVVGPGHLVTEGWSNGNALLGVAATVPSLILFVAVALKAFRWEPRQ
ncbi:ABC transporter permease [Actinocrispum wychmicini]|uniref:ABC-2 type transport system permease protein n=1 Tax=Actinocrispum wychmicini TaxID=1213861 RepID=A0A4R2K692_9PSEU|nr:ABC transporter permease [Actinocrispum wychmicini]TCO65328.1 ABC-2 type transport system permease protein [Actinocrispum wychmicini]